MKHRGKVAFVVFFVLLMTMYSLVYAEERREVLAYFGQVKLLLNNEEVGSTTLLIDGSTYLPLREVAELLNKEVSYDDETKTAYINDTNATFMTQSQKTLVPEASMQEIDVFFGRVNLVVNGAAVDKQTLLYNGATYVPLRAALEILNMEVLYDDTTKTANIFTPQPQEETVVENQDITPDIAEEEESSDIMAISGAEPEDISTKNDETIYWYTDLENDSIEKYTTKLENAGYQLLDMYSGKDYKVYTKDKEFIEIDHAAYADENQVLVINSTHNPDTYKKFTIQYKAEHPPVVGLNKRAFYSMEDNDLTKGVDYWYELDQKSVTEFTLQDIALALSRHGYYLIEEDEDYSGYILFKDGMSVRLRLEEKDRKIYLVTEVSTTFATHYSSLDHSIDQVFPWDSSFYRDIHPIFNEMITNDSTAVLYFEKSKEEMQEYLESLLDNGFTKDDTRLYNIVYTNGDIDVTVYEHYIDDEYSFTVHLENVALKKSRKTDINVFPSYQKHSGLVDFGAFIEPDSEPFRTTESKDGVTVYWYNWAEEYEIKDYLQTLDLLGFAYDKEASKEGYAVFKKDGLVITVDSGSHKNVHTLIKVLQK